MKLLICTLISTLLTGQALANCAAISDPDQRAYCRALEQRNAARCVEIQNQSLRQQCRVELGDNPANCNTISNPSEREMCRARAR